jgi:hypothetical protein
MWQQWIVFLIVALAAAHVCAKYLPASLRMRMVYFLTYLLTRRGARPSKAAAALALWSDGGAGCGGGCSGCSGKTPCRTDAAGEPEKRAQQTTQRVIRLHPHPHASPTVE